MYKRTLFTKEAQETDIPPVVPVEQAVQQPSYLHPDVVRYMEQLQPKPNATYVLVSAMGAGEQWGPNINGDFFPYGELVTHTPDWLAIPVDDVRGRAERAAAIGKGYPTFYLAHAFKHHQNKDPAKAIGFIEVAVWNEDMRRVELVIKLDHHLAKQHGADAILQKILDGEYVDVSMGCRVKYDVCSICGNKATKREEYCEHIRKRRIERDPLGNGKRPYMINVEPRFFDLSFVFVGADRAARVLKKLAHVEDPIMEHLIEGISLLYPEMDSYQLEKAASLAYAEGVAPYEELPGEILKEASVGPRAYVWLDGLGARLERYSKLASFLHDLEKAALAGHKTASYKLADLIKYVVPPEDLEEAQVDEEGLPPDVLEELQRCGLPEAVGTTVRARIVLTPREFAHLMMHNSGMGHLAESLGELPQSEEMELPFSAGLLPSVAPLLARLLSAMEHRSLTGPRVKRIVVIKTAPKLAYREDYSPLAVKLASAYNGYRVWLLANAEKLGFFEGANAEEARDIAWYLENANWSTRPARLVKEANLLSTALEAGRKMFSSGKAIASTATRVGIGAAGGALIDSNNRWRGMFLGGLAGLASKPVGAALNKWLEGAGQVAAKAEAQAAKATAQQAAKTTAQQTAKATAGTTGQTAQQAVQQTSQQASNVASQSVQTPQRQGLFGRIKGFFNRAPQLPQEAGQFYNQAIAEANKILQANKQSLTLDQMKQAISNLADLKQKMINSARPYANAFGEVSMAEKHINSLIQRIGREVDEFARNLERFPQYAKASRFERALSGGFSKEAYVRRGYSPGAIAAQAIVGAALGGTAGAFVDKEKPLRGAVIGGALGGVGVPVVAHLIRRASPPEADGVSSEVSKLRAEGRKKLEALKRSLDDATRRERKKMEKMLRDIEKGKGSGYRPSKGTELDRVQERMRRGEKVKPEEIREAIQRDLDKMGPI